MNKSFSLILLFTFSLLFNATAQLSKVKTGFFNPPAISRPGVYWYFMDGNMNKESMTKDLESMKKAGIGNVIFLEVNVGVPVGPVDFLSEQWQDMFKHAVRESERLGIEITLGIGPGWTGSGGPWVPADQSMQHLVSSSVSIKGGTLQKIKLPLPLPKKPFFGDGSLTPELIQQRLDFYKDIAVLAYPTPSVDKTITDIDEKALYYRAPYSSQEGVKQFLPYPFTYPEVPKDAVVAQKNIIDLTSKLQADGTLNWEAPAGNWTIMRFVSRNNGAATRPAPVTGLGFESDKFDTVALNAHLNKYIGTLLKKVGKSDPKLAGGLKRLHMDSWEMGSQNWTANFRQQFIKRRGYDPLPFYPVYAGQIVESPEISERFLWDLRQTSQELVLEYHAEAVKKYAHKNGLSLSIEPYDMNPTADLELGSVADWVMSEFWSKGYGYNSTFSVTEATSVAHINGQAVVPSEAFTAQDDESWKQYPGSMKNQGDWAFAAGLNRFVYHTFQNQELPDSLRPGMTMGPYGVHWDRNQTWWPMANGYHHYISSTQYVLQQGRTVADVLYLTPEGSPHVFRPPSSALKGDVFLPDRKAYNFDGCAPGQLFKATVNNGRIVFPSGASYRILVLPAVKTMTPALLQKIKSLVSAGATIIGSPPLKSPGLAGFPTVDADIKSLSASMWGSLDIPEKETTHAFGKGRVIWGGQLDKQINDLYPEYDLTAKILNEMGIKQDFTTAAPLRYTHRTSADWDIYFVSNTTGKACKASATFRSNKGIPSLWDAAAGTIRSLPEYQVNGEQTTIPLQFVPNQSYFIVFSKTNVKAANAKRNFSERKVITTLSGPWKVAFDPKWGGPASVTFDALKDWTLRPEDGIKYYSGIAVYHKVFDVGKTFKKGDKLYLNLGDIKNLARVKLNGKDLGVIWTAPYSVDISGLVLPKGNQLQVEVANLWPNRLIGDASLPYDGVKNGQWPEWLTKGLPRNSGRYTFTSYSPYTKNSPLLPSGLLGPVTIELHTDQ
ncbi:glycosyl hydrolase [Pedobacter sp. L105]|uniref:glycosyl hydrolase n=1 Tax=Pedobacter sp. L105 TaxID=1641871 RepID=UPI0020B13B3D|nr:glycosyl hydrolase [Pedobacter sp. L105]